MRNDEYQEGGCGVYLAAFEPHKLLQGPVCTHFERRSHEELHEKQRKMEVAHLPQMLALDPEGLVQEGKMVMRSHLNRSRDHFTSLRLNTHSRVLRPNYVSCLS